MQIPHEAAPLPIELRLPVTERADRADFLRLSVKARPGIVQQSSAAGLDSATQPLVPLGELGRFEVEQADQAIREAMEREAAREKEREAFAENLPLAPGRYEAGAGDIIEMIDAQLQMAAAETALVQARFDRATALATLYRALGRLPQESR